MRMSVVNLSVSLKDENISKYKIWCILTINISENIVDENVIGGHIRECHKSENH